MVRKLACSQKKDEGVQQQALIFSLTAAHNSSLSETLQGRTAQQEGKVLHSQDNKVC